MSEEDESLSERLARQLRVRDPRYQMQPSEADQAEEARAAAARRTRTAVMPEEGRPDSGAADVMINMVPGVGPLRAAAGGHYGEAATGAALQALPAGLGLIGRNAAKYALGAYAGGTAMAPAVAGAPKSAGRQPGSSGMFDTEADAELRKQWEAQYRAAETPKGQRDVLAAFNAEQQRRRSDEAARLQEEQRLAKNAGAFSDWKGDRAQDEQFKRLAGPVQSKILEAPNLPQAQSYYTQAMEDQRKANLTFGERDPQTMQRIQEGAAIAGAALPFLCHIRSGPAAAAAARDAEGAFASTYGRNAPATPTQGALNDLALKRNVLEQHTGTPWGHYAAGTALDASIPAAAGVVVPNAIDMATSERGSDLRRKAYDQLTDPHNYARSGAEGIAAALTGHAAGAGTRAAIWGPQAGKARALVSAIDHPVPPTPRTSMAQTPAPVPTPAAPSTPAAPTAPAPHANGATAPMEWKTPTMYQYRGAVAKNLKRRLDLQ